MRFIPDNLDERGWKSHTAIILSKILRIFSWKERKKFGWKERNAGREEK
jgi:hypothetical protein